VGWSAKKKMAVSPTAVDMMNVVMMTK